MSFSSKLQKNPPSGFSLIEFLVVAAIMGLIAAAILVATGPYRVKGRDSRRLSDIELIQKSLEMYYENNNKTYPTIITVGQPLADATNTYLAAVPSNPTPRTDGGCPNVNYAYYNYPTSNTYDLITCLGNGINEYPGGAILATPQDISTSTSNLLTINDGLQLWLKFDGNANDSSGNGYNGVWAGTPAYATGVLGQAASMDGQANSISFASPTGDLLDMGTNDWTVNVWVKTADTNFSIISKSAAADAVSRWYISGESGTLYGGFQGNAGSANALTAIGSINNDTWHMLTTIWQRNDTVKNYIDGSYVANSGNIAAQASYNMQSTYYLLIGCYGNSSVGADRGQNCYWSGAYATSLLYQGYLDDLRVYNRALTATEIQTLLARRNTY